MSANQPSRLSSKPPPSQPPSRRSVPAPSLKLAATAPRRPSLAHSGRPDRELSRRDSGSQVRTASTDREPGRWLGQAEGQAPAASARGPAGVGALAAPVSPIASTARMPSVGGLAPRYASPATESTWMARHQPRRPASTGTAPPWTARRYFVERQEAVHRSPIESSSTARRSTHKPTSERPAGQAPAAQKPPVADAYPTAAFCPSIPSVTCNRFRISDFASESKAAENCCKHYIGRHLRDFSFCENSSFRFGRGPFFSFQVLAPLTCDLRRKCP
jgi:hypothetical protein